MVMQAEKLLGRSDYQAYLQNGLNYEDYKQRMTRDSRNNPDEKIREYIRLNQARMARVEKTYSIGAALAEQLKRVTQKIYWLILTEHWCGDAAQILPALQRIVALSDERIEMKLVYRDENPELMAAYLTNSARSIPKLIQLNSHQIVTGIWGPRPSEAQKLVRKLKLNPVTAPTYSIELHKWYAHDKQRTLELEVGKLLVRAMMLCPDCII